MTTLKWFKHTTGVPDIIFYDMDAFSSIKTWKILIKTAKTFFVQCFTGFLWSNNIEIMHVE